MTSSDISTPTMPCIVLLGPPGTGKTTHARALSDRLNLPYVSASSIIIKRHGRPKLGDYSPNEIVIDLVLHELAGTNYEKGFLLDGFPRNSIQASIFCKRFFTRCNVFVLTAPKTVLIERLLTRHICPQCARVFGKQEISHQNVTRCNACNIDLIKRDLDDSRVIMNQRIDKEMADYEQVTSILESKHNVRLFQSSDPLHVVTNILETQIRRAMLSLGNRPHLS